MKRWNVRPVLTEVEVVECRDEPDGPLGNPVGSGEEMPGDESDLFAQLDAERKAIITEFAGRLRSATPATRRLIKAWRKSAIAAATRRINDAAAGRRRRRKTFRPKKGQGRRVAAGGRSQLGRARTL
jgi:hypothetical protein